MGSLSYVNTRTYPAPAHSGGCPVFEAEELGLEQRFDLGRTVHGDEWSAPPGQISWI
jgi:hypothetical protein